MVLLIELYERYRQLKTHTYTPTHIWCHVGSYGTTAWRIHYTGSCCFFGNQFNQHFSWAVVRTLVAMGCNKTYAGGVNLYKFPIEMKDLRLLSVSMLWSSDRLVLKLLTDAHYPHRTPCTL